MKPENGDDAVDQQTEDQLLAEDELEGENLENFNKLTEYGINKNVARELIKIYETGTTMFSRTYFLCYRYTQFGSWRSVMFWI